MKKMKCEICGSFSIKKENGVFVCQECGTEYSLEDAKKLLTEIDDSKTEKVDKEQKKEENLEKIKLEYDLLCWHNFYKKCHELENIYQVADDNREIDKNIDITSRNLVWDKNEKRYFDSDVKPLVQEEFVKTHSDYSKKEQEYMKSMDRKMQNYEMLENQRLREIDRDAKLGMAFMIIGAILLGLGFIFVWFSVFGKIVLPLGIAVEIIGIIIWNKKHYQKLTIDEIHIDENYLSKLLDKDPLFKDYENKVKIKYQKECSATHDYIISKVQDLTTIKNNLIKNIPLPQKYSDEEHVNALLALVLDGRADTLKEAINLYETEAYRNTVVNSLNVLNYNIVQLNNNIMNLRNEVTNLTSVVQKGFDILIQQNNYISMSLDSIKFDTRYLMIDSLLS